ncbi:MAG: serine/threonine protein kinase, partial [Myxococcales bacterium]|nr:serine/threonine protein kinase [Myxococcales bacterium]
MANDKAKGQEFARGDTLEASSVPGSEPEISQGGPPLDDLPRPQEIGHYTVIGTLGAGGMGVVYVAHDRRLDRRVALKLLRRADAGETARARLLREAQAMARLSHPHVVAVHEVGTHDNQVFLAMEFVGGSNLRAWLNMRPRSWREIVAVFLQAGSGLVAAHEAGLIHRDFKPDNVLVGDDGRVRVADFGLAHGRQNQEPTPISFDSNITLDKPLTETGAVLGTPAYMALEQHLGRKVDARCDQFSFCVA